MNYNLKMQVKSNNRWVDKINYFYIWNLTDYICDDVNYSDGELKEIINHYYDLSDYIYPHLRQLVNRSVRHIENNSVTKYKNLTRYIEIVDNLEFEIPELWRNINILLKHLYRLKKYLVDNKILNLNFFKVRRGNTKVVTDFLEFLKRECEALENYKLAYANFLAGRHYSVLEDRSKAFELFSNYLSYSSSIENLIMSSGIHTYLDIDNYNDNLPIINPPLLLDEKPLVKNSISIIVSVDVDYLRKYGPQLFVNIIALKKYHFHIHVIGDNNETIKVIEEAKNLFKNTLLFYNTNREVLAPTFSTEEVPEYVLDVKTYYACSRFIHAEIFKEWFNNDLLIIDVDFLITDDLKNMLNIINKHDVALTITEGITSMTPWTRAMGGTLFLKNNDKTNSFINYTKNYILHGLKLKNSWILDQNALCYACEKFYAEDEKNKIFSIPFKIRPLKQFRIRYFMEERF